MKNFLIFLIDKYKKYISPIIEYHGIKCKYFPTCSEYAKQAIKKHGAVYGTFLAIKRFFKCNPFSKGGYDPVK